MTVRHLIREPLTEPEIRALAPKVGGLENLVAPKRRKEAAGLTGDKLVKWLAADGGRIRRPIIVRGGKVLLGFAKDTQEALGA